MEAEIARVLVRDVEIEARLEQLAAEIGAAYQPLEGGVTLLPIMSGAIIFLADLIRKLPFKLKIALIGVSTYPGRSTTPQQARTVLGLNTELKDRHVLIVDDILDTGGTLRRVRALVEQQAPASVRAAVLLRKPSKTPPDVTAEFIGFDIADEFVVGYGLDYDDHYRNYPHIAVLRPDAM